MADGSEIDAALVAKLLGDTTLAGLMPDGVFFDVSSAGAQRFVLVSLADDAADVLFDGDLETPTYLVKAVALSTSGGNAKAAAARIHALLHRGTLTIGGGYALMEMRRTRRVRAREVSEADASIYWDHRGGYYEVMVTI